MECVRSYGFDLNTGAQARIVQGQLRRAVTPEAKIIDLWVDGTLIAAARGDEDFLSWGRHASPGGPLRISQLVMVEYTYLFAELSQRVYNLAQPRPRGIEYRLELRNMTINDTPCGLIPGPMGTFATTFGTDIHHAPGPRATFTVPWEEVEIDPRIVAFLLIRKIYEWFGIEHEYIPYTERIDHRVIISPDQLQAVR
jgi:hypothetical protein